MMRSVVALVLGIILAVMVLYFAIPLLKNEQSATNSLFNATDPTIQMSQTLGDGFYSALPLLGIITGTFLIIAVALRYIPGE